MTAIEVIDTAIKISFGGIIGFASTYIVAKLNNDHEKSKEAAKRHFDTLEQVASHIEEYSHVALKYWALVVECVRFENEGKEWPLDRREQLDIVKNEIFSEAKNVTIAESKLLLFGLEEASEKLREYIDYLKVFRRKYYIGKSNLTEEDMDSARDQLLTLRRNLFNELSRAYKTSL